MMRACLTGTEINRCRADNARHLEEVVPTIFTISVFGTIEPKFSPIFRQTGRANDRDPGLNGDIGNAKIK